MSYFLAQNHLKPQYFNAQLLHGALGEEASTRSGYWRLFFYNMQEEALKKLDAPIEVKVSEEPNEQVERQAAPQGARKAKKRKPTVVAIERYPEVRFKRKPIYTKPTPVAENLPLWLAEVSLEFNAWLNATVPQWRKRLQEKAKVDAAANDADYRLRILLLAA